MFPAIADGETVEISPATNNRTGDVVLLASDDRLLAHRIVGSCENMFHTRGDSCFEDDRPADRHSVFGYVSAVITPSGRRSPHTWRTRLRALVSRLLP